MGQLLHKALRERTPEIMMVLKVLILLLRMAVNRTRTKNDFIRAQWL